MQVREAMSTRVLSVGPAHSLRQAAALMTERRVGAAVVIDPDGEGHGILTERDIMACVGAGGDVDVEHVSSHLTRDLVYADPSWTLQEAAAAMVRGGFRHLVVIEDHDVVGVLSVRDIVRVWTETSRPSVTA
ncbi:cyclic nucleotide-binding/CBS domain-containing protein [Stackebrandtia soli]|uniref:CBS domain-containing protein n=1 Tax=Stackebrandtia soli TaxID=1892856 RepID=UPI0039ED5B55